MVWFGLVLLQVVTFDWQAEPASFARSPIPPRPATHSFRRLTRVDESLPHDWRVADSDVTDSRSPATGSESPPQRTSSAANFLRSELRQPGLLRTGSTAAVCPPYLVTRQSIPPLPANNVNAGCLSATDSGSLSLAPPDIHSGTLVNSGLVSKIIEWLAGKCNLA